MGTSNSAAMGCSQPKEFRTGLRIVGSFLKVKLYYNMCGTQVLLRLPDRRGLTERVELPPAAVLLSPGRGAVEARLLARPGHGRAAALGKETGPGSPL